jgi:hypothetical protein
MALMSGGSLNGRQSAVCSNQRKALNPYIDFPTNIFVGGKYTATGSVEQSGVQRSVCGE